MGVGRSESLELVDEGVEGSGGKEDEREEGGEDKGEEDGDVVDTVEGARWERRLRVTGGRVTAIGQLGDPQEPTQQ